MKRTRPFDWGCHRLRRFLWRWKLLWVLIVLLSLPFAVWSEELKNWPPTSPKQIADVYRQGVFLEERVCHPTNTSSYACDLVLMPDGTGRIILYTNDTVPIKMIAVHPDGRTKVVWEALQI